MLTVLLCPGVFAAEKTTAQPRQILTTAFPLTVFASNLTRGMQGWSVETLGGNAHGCLHDYTLKPADAVRLKAADLVLMNGGGMENGGLLKLLQSVDKARLLNVGGALPQLAAGDPHFAGDPQVAGMMIAAIAERLLTLEPSSAKQLNDNLGDYLKRINQVAQEMRTLRSLAHGMSVATLSDALERFVRACGFTLQKLFYDNEFVQPTAKQVANAPKAIRELGIHLLFVESIHPGRYATELATSSAARVVTLDPLTEGPEQPPYDYYEQTMRANLQKVRQAIENGTTVRVKP